VGKPLLSQMVIPPKTSLFLNFFGRRGVFKWERDPFFKKVVSLLYEPWVKT